MPVLVTSRAQATHPRSSRDADPVLSLVVALLVLAPYSALLVSFEAGLLLQAAIVFGLLGATGALGLATAGRSRSPVPRAVQWGLALYAAAALWGATVGLLSGNPVRNVLSQSTSLLLLPAGFLAFWFHRRFQGADLVRGLSWAALGSLAIHLAGLMVPGLGAPGRDEGFRFILRNNVMVSGALVMTFLLILGLVLGRVRPGVWEVLGLSATILLLLGGMSRGAWLVALLGVGVLTVFPATRPGLRRLAMVGGLPLFLVGAVWLCWYWSERQLVPLVRETFDGREKLPEWWVSEPALAHSGAVCIRVAPGSMGNPPVPVLWDVAAPAPMIEVHGWAKGLGGEILTLAVHARNAEGERIGDRLTVLEGASSWAPFRWLVPLPPRTSEIRLLAAAGEAKSAWFIDDVEVLAATAPIVGWMRQLSFRLTSTVEGLQAPSLDGSLRYRLDETREVLREWGRSSWVSQLTGAGLGAIFTFENLTWDREGNRAVAREASYIHNFYLFLGYKLGIAGAVALAALLGIVIWTADAALRRGKGAWLLSSAVAAWVSYLLWSVTSPEIYDFRVAPLWGALVVACCRETDPSAAAPGRSPSERHSQPPAP